MAKRSRWKGEWLVEVDDQGRIMLPRLTPDFDAGSPQPTHYQVKTIYGRGGHLELIPMRVATAEDLRPEPDAESEDIDDVPPRGYTRAYTKEELASLEHRCPHCGAQPHTGCFARPSMQPLTNYPENPRWVHKRRLDLVTAITPEGDS